MTPSQSEARIRELEQRDKERARLLLRTQAFLRAAERVAADERRQRLAAEQNAAHWHALLLQERIRNLPNRNEAA